MSLLSGNWKSISVAKKKIFVFFVFLYAITLLFTHIYSISIDNFYISCVLNGLYDTDNYCIFVHPFVASVVKLLNSKLPDADFFCIFQILFTFFGYIWLQFCLYRTTEKTADYFICATAFFSFIVLLDIAHTNFTIAAAFLAFVGFISLSHYICSSLNFTGIIFGLFFLVIGLLWRIQAVLLLLPFFLLTSFNTFFFTESSQKRKIILRSFLCIFLVAVSLCTIYGTKKKTDASPLYADAVDYNTARSKLQDYPVPLYTEVKEELDQSNITENDYSVATDMIFFDTEFENTAFLQKLTKIFAEKDVKNTVSQFISALIDVDSYSSLVGIVLLLLFVLIYSVSVLRFGQKQIRIEMFCAIGGTILIFVYFFILGRLLDRILISVLLGLFQIILLRLPKIFIHFSYAERKSTVPLYLCLIVSLACSTVSFAQRSTWPENAFQTKSDVDYGPYETVLDNSNLYIWDTYYLKNFVFETLIPQGKLYTEEFLDNNIPDGEWIYGQTYFSGYLSRLGISNPVKELLCNDHCYYISRQYRKDIVLKYIQEHYDENATMEKCGDIILDEERSLSIFKINP